MIAEHLGRELTITAVGQKLVIARWTREIWNRFLEWAKTKLPDPLEAITRNIDKITLKDAAALREIMRQDQEETVKAKAEGREPILLADKFRGCADELVKLAATKAGSALSLTSPEVQSLIGTPDGGAYLIFLLLQKHQPDITHDKALEVYDDLGPDKIGGIFKMASGKYEGSGKNGSVPAG